MRSYFTTGTAYYGWEVGRGLAEGLRGPRGDPSSSLQAPSPCSSPQAAELSSHLDGLRAEGLQHFGADLICTCNPDRGAGGQRRERGLSWMVLEGQSTGSQGLTKPCADEEPGDTLRVIVLLAPEDLTSHSFLLQLRRRREVGGAIRKGGNHHGGRKGQASLRN